MRSYNLLNTWPLHVLKAFSGVYSGVARNIFHTRLLLCAGKVQTAVCVYREPKKVPGLSLSSVINVAPEGAERTRKLLQTKTYKLSLHGTLTHGGKKKQRHASFVQCKSAEATAMQAVTSVTPDAFD